MSTKEHRRPDVIRKAFAVLPAGLLQCLVCGNVFTAETAWEHAEADCHPFLELCLIEPPQGGNDVA